MQDFSLTLAPPRGVRPGFRKYTLGFAR